MAVRNWAAGLLVCILGLRSNGLQAERPVSKESSSLEPGLAALPEIRVDIFYETLCPDCQSLLGESLLTLWKDPTMQAALRVHLHPSGNVELTSVGDAQELNCQHGTDECHGNALHACAMKVWEPENYLPVVMCMEATKPESAEDIDKAFSSCASARNLSIHEVTSCMEGTEVQSMMIGHYHATEALKPPHEWVPWVLLNGEHDYHADMGQLHEAICNVMQSGSGVLPANCHPIASLAEASQNSTTAQLCYAGKRAS
mmetsp:Transcript_27761/g.64140  ORF Transcript_27761/g.64140 Transcript_27761/m.64140 type:complete len:257 (-) Transcript_27761:42-812(-)